MNELKPCPFCGSENIELRSDFGEKSSGCRTAHVKCWDCHASSDIKDSCTGDKEEDAVKAWNKRSPENIHCFYFGGEGCMNQRLGGKPYKQQ